MDINPALLTIIIGGALDTIVGDPYWLPHPIRLFGSMISRFEAKLNRGANRRLKGGVMWVTLCLVTLLFFGGVEVLIADFQIVNIAWCSIFFFYGLSNRCLIEEGFKVEKIVASGDIDGARKQLSMIVGRDTTQLNPTQIRSAIIETMSENLSDGVVAPLFYYAIGGIPLMMLYKMINTLDSMVGYKSERYKNFGYLSAKMDDVANFIPARLTALMMVVVTMSWRAVQHVKRYARSHTSPNSGYPESALSGLLDCRLGGANYYFGKVVNKPYIGENPRDITHLDVVKTALVNAKVAMLSLIILIVVASVTNL